MERASPLLNGDSITRNFGGHTALKEVSFEIQAGAILGLIGPNGAGKTTLINIMSGILKPNGGKLWFNGRDITDFPPEAVCHLGINRTFQIPQSFPHLTTVENIEVGLTFGGSSSKLKGGEIKTKALEIAEFTGLIPKARVLAKDLTAAELRKLDLARALGTNPRLLLLDEFHTGLNFEQAEQAMDLIRNVRSQGVTILIVEHNMSIVTRLCERIIVLNYGQKIAEGTPSEILSNEQVIEAYLGES